MNTILNIYKKSYCNSFFKKINVVQEVNWVRIDFYKKLYIIYKN